MTPDPTKPLADLADRPYLVRESMANNRLWKSSKSALGRLDIELTERCNNRCQHCYINQPENKAALKNRELPLAQLQEIIRQAADLGCLTIRFTGGEPLLRDSFADIYRFTRRLGIKVLLFTNATRLTPEIVQLLRQMPPGEKIEITLYGLNQASYENVSGVPGSFAAAVAGIQRLWAAEVPFIIKGVYLEATAGEIDGFEQLAGLLPHMDQPPGFALNFDLRARRDDPQKNALIRTLRASPEETVAFLSRHAQRYRVSMKAFAQSFLRPPGNALFTCGCGRGGAVDAYGYLQPCLLMRHPETVYDLPNGTLRDALANFFPGLRQKTATNPDYLNRCARCFLSSLCDSCPAQSWMAHGTLDTPVDYHCRIAHAKAAFLGLIQPDEAAWQVPDWAERIRRFVDDDPAPAPADTKPLSTPQGDIP